MDKFFDYLRSILFTNLIGNINLYMILSSLFKYFFAFIVLYFVYIVVRIISLDIKNSYDKGNRIKSIIELIAKDGKEVKKGDSIELDNYVSIGRNYNNTMVLEDDSISRNHAIIIKKNDGYYIEDQNSSNGTFINDRMIYSCVKLNDKDIIGIGSYQYIYYEGDDIDYEN